MTIHDPLVRLTAIPVIPDDTVPAGTAVLDVDPEDPRHITRIRARACIPTELRFTVGQHEQIRDHYRAMDERAGRLLAEWRAMERFAAAAVPDPPHPPYLITGV